MSFSYLDKLQYADLITNSLNDVRITTDNLAAGGSEANPLVKPIAGQGGLHTMLSMLILAGLGKRWNEMDDPTQKRVEMLLSNLVEASALEYSRTNGLKVPSWRITLGGTEWQ